MKHDDLLELTIEKLRWLRLPGMARTLTDLIESAKQQNLSALEVASRLADEEKASRIRAPSTAACEMLASPRSIPSTASTSTSIPCGRSSSPLSRLARPELRR